MTLQKMVSRPTAAATRRSSPLINEVPMNDFLLSAPTLTGAHLATMRGLLDRLRSVPELADRYDGISTIDSLDDLAKIPLMVKNDLNVALEHLKPKAENATTWTFQSGGSTGAPKLGYAPTGLYMDEVYAHWKPLGRDDLFVNAWSAGKMWGSHYLNNCLVDLSKCTAISLGAIARTEYDAWLEFFRVRGVTAIGGTPSVLRLIFGHAADTGVVLPDLRTVTWLGEAWDNQLNADIPKVAPNAGRWGLYGSTETWVIGWNTPRCAQDTWHPLPSQLIHIGEGEMLDFTSLKPDGLNPVLRYQTGDAGRYVTCPCGRDTTALQALGRRDGVVKFRGFLLNVDDIVAEVSTRPGVMRVQLMVTEFAEDRGAELDVLVVATRDAAPDLPEQLRTHIVGSAFGLSTVFNHDPESFRVRLVDAPVANERTGKTSNLVMRQG
jgi:phenylacetate-coenzyme A ligase PaaK-like adenylate-forming protein